MPAVAAGDGEVQEELISSYGNSAVCHLVVTTQKLSSVSLSAATRLQEDGAQGQQLARELFHLQPLSAAHRYQELCDKGQQQLLPALLREAVRTEVLLLQDGKRTVSQSGSHPSLIFLSFESPLVWKLKADSASAEPNIDIKPLQHSRVFILSPGTEVSTAWGCFLRRSRRWGWQQSAHCWRLRPAPVAKAWARSRKEPERCHSDATTDVPVHGFRLTRDRFRSTSYSSLFWV